MRKKVKSVLLYIVIAILCSFVTFNDKEDVVRNTVEYHTVIQSEPVKNNSYQHRVNVINLTEEEQVCLATNIYYEARGEGFQGMIAVAYVTLNRTYHHWFPNNVCDVVYQKNKNICQFSWTCVQGIHANNIAEHKMFEKARNIVNMMVNSYHKASDPTGGALFFHSTKVDPSWRVSFQRTARIQNHIFYKPN